MDGELGLEYHIEGTYGKAWLGRLRGTQRQEGVSGYKYIYISSSRVFLTSLSPHYSGRLTACG